MYTEQNLPDDRLGLARDLDSRDGSVGQVRLESRAVFLGFLAC
jgi:hypothetical protein